jgi:hypothetical protein
MGAKPAEQRFHEKTVIGEPSDFRPDLGPCLIYVGADNGNGYGQFRYNGRNGYAHRYAWERVHGPITDNLTVDHLCRVRCCVNIEHLELVDAVENYRRGARIRTRCSKGHEYTADNLYLKASKPGHRLCKKCFKDTMRRCGDRRTNEAKGLPDGRIKYDAILRDKLANDVVDRKLTVAQAAVILGCAPKYMDKRARLVARSRGITNRRAA